MILLSGLLFLLSGLLFLLSGLLFLYLNCCSFYLECFPFIWIFVPFTLIFSFYLEIFTYIWRLYLFNSLLIFFLDYVPNLSPPWFNPVQATELMVYWFGPSLTTEPWRSYTEDITCKRLQKMNILCPRSLVYLITPVTM